VFEVSLRHYELELTLLEQLDELMQRYNVEDVEDD
jgi:hypothetical protein